MTDPPEFTKLGNSVSALVEEVDILKQGLYALVTKNKNVDYDDLVKMVTKVGQATDECKNAFHNYKASRTK